MKVEDGKSVAVILEAHPNAASSSELHGSCDLTVSDATVQGTLSNIGIEVGNQDNEAVDHCVSALKESDLVSYFSDFGQNSVDSPTVEDYLLTLDVLCTLIVCYSEWCTISKFGCS